MTLPRRRIVTPPGVPAVRGPLLEVTEVQPKPDGRFDAYVAIEEHDDHGVTAYVVWLDWDAGNRAWYAYHVDPPPPPRLLQALGEKAVEAMQEHEGHADDGRAA